jgi:hypothetical protein
MAGGYSFCGNVRSTEEYDVGSLVRSIMRNAALPDFDVCHRRSVKASVRTSMDVPLGIVLI